METVVWLVTASEIEISSFLNRTPSKDSKKSKIFFAIGLNLLIYYGHRYLYILEVQQDR